MRRPAILQLVSSTGLYGAERVLLELACSLRDRGWPSHVGALEPSPGARVAVIEEARRRGLSTVLFPGRAAGALPAIRRHVEQHGINICHSHGYKSDILLYLSGAGRAARLVATCHNWLTDSPKLMLYELLDKLCLHRFDHVVGVSPALMRELALAGIDEGRRSLIDNGLALGAAPDPARRPALRRGLGVEEHELMLVSVGRLDPWKAYDVLLEALAHLAAAPRHRLVLVGDGDLRVDLEAQVARLGLGERVRFAGYRRDVAELLLAADLMVISSRKEGLPMVLLEAMAAGLPIVTTAVGAIPSAVREGREALIVPPEDPAALARAIERLLRAPEERRALATAATERYQERYSRQAMGERYAALYERLLG